MFASRALEGSTWSAHLAPWRGFAAAAAGVLCALGGAAGPAAARTIGPEAYGYTATDEVAFAFEDISGTGALTLALTDDGVFTAGLGFRFNFYGQDYDTVSWSTNGLLSFGGVNSQFTNVNLAVTRTIGDRPSVAVLWDDWQFLDARSEGAYYETRGAPGSRRFIVQWTKAFAFDSQAESVTFQAILFEGRNTILLQYLDVDSGDAASSGAQATVGIRDTAGHTNGRNLVWSFNSGVIAAGQAIRIGAFADASPPVVAITEPAGGAVIGAGSVLVAADIADQSPTAVLSEPPGVQAALPEGGGSASGAVPLAEGSNTITVFATDEAGNAGGDSVTVIRDSTPPSATILSPASGTVFGESPAALTVEVSDATATAVVFGGNSVALPAGGGIAAGEVALAEGANAITVTVTDAANNVTSASVELVLDLNAPVVTIDSPADGSAFGPGESPIPVVVTVNDLTGTAVSSVPAGISGSTPAGGGIVAGAVALAEGLNRITATATDSSGRSGSASIAVLLDTTPPSVTVDSPSLGQALSGLVDFSASAEDGAPGSGISRVDFLADGSLLASLERPPFEMSLDTAGLADGVHTLEAAAIDGKGNSALASIRVTVDNTPPAVAFLLPLDGVQVSGMMAFHVEAGDAGGSGLTRLEVLAGGVEPPGAPAAVYDPPAPAGLLAGDEDSTRRPDGPLTLEATAVDAAGNRAAVAVTVMVENLAPPDLALAPADGSIVSGIVPITVESSGPGVELLEILVDGVPQGSSPASPFTIQFDTRSRLDGEMLITAAAQVAGGSSAAASAKVTVDNLSVRLRPAALYLGSRGCGPVVVEIAGLSAHLLLPVAYHGIELRVPGGSPVPADPEWAGCGHLRGEKDESPRLLVRFDRQRVIAAIRAGIAGGWIEPESTIEVSVAAGGLVLGSASLAVVHGRQGD